MANITDPRVITWSDQRGRTISDSIERLYYDLIAYQTDWAAQGINALIVAAGNTNLVGDTSVTGPDGRQQITGLALQNLLAAINQIVTAIGTTTVTGVGATPKAIVDGIEVNGTPR
jgi:hypothetical protein